MVKKELLWDTLFKQRTFFDNLGKRLNYRHWEDWYQVRENSHKVYS